MAIRQTLRDAGAVNPLTFVSDGDQVVAYFNGVGKFADRKNSPLPTVLLLDLKMPRMSGFEVMQWLGAHKEFKDVLTVILSGPDELGNMRQAYQLGARSFLTKPCKVEDVKNLMRAYSTYWEMDRGQKDATEGA
jgi:CheY-like chemotaxis protein